MGDTYFLQFYIKGAIFQYCFLNGIISAIQLTIATILIRDTLPNHHIPTFALGAITTDLLARTLLHQSLFSAPSIALLLAALPTTLQITQKIRLPVQPAPTKPLPSALGAFLLTTLLVSTYLLCTPTTDPIPLLVDQGALQFHEYTQTATSSTLRGAVAEYHARYGRPPPPGFDIWYQYASDRRSKVINEFDQIVGDLRVFWGVEPPVLRERVVRAAAVGGNDLAHIRIRDGKAEIASAPQWRVRPRGPFVCCLLFVVWANLGSGCRRRWFGLLMRLSSGCRIWISCSMRMMNRGWSSRGRKNRRFMKLRRNHGILPLQPENTPIGIPK
jgi:hypothetical protein